jgi:hypothetical protein
VPTGPVAACFSCVTQRIDGSAIKYMVITNLYLLSAGNLVYVAVSCAKPVRVEAQLMLPGWFF